MDWLRSEDLKEEKNVITPATSIAGIHHLAGSARLPARKCLATTPLQSRS